MISDAVGQHHIGVAAGKLISRDHQHQSVVAHGGANRPEVIVDALPRLLLLDGRQVISGVDVLKIRFQMLAHRRVPVVLKQIEVHLKPLKGFVLFPDEVVQGIQCDLTGSDRLLFGNGGHADAPYGGHASEQEKGDDAQKENGFLKSIGVMPRWPSVFHCAVHLSDRFCILA